MSPEATDRSRWNEELLTELRRLLGERLDTTAAVRDHHSRGESHFPPHPPDAVAFPESTEEVRSITAACSRHLVPVVCFGAGTSLEGHVAAVRGGVSLDMTRMNRLVRLSVEDMDVTVEAGMTREQLNQALRRTGLCFFVDPGADATLGGMAATRASGTTAVRYGTMRDNVLGLTVVLADGRVIRTGGRARKSAAGYDLTGLFVGSEGTLGVITEVTLRLHAIPEAISAAVCPFDRIEGAVDAVIAIVQMGIAVARIELLDEVQMDAVNRFSDLDYPVAPTLFLEFHGLTERGVAEQAEMARAVAAEHGGHDFRWATRTEDRSRLWKARHDAYFATLALRPGAKAWVTDVGVPISRLAEAIRAAKEDAAAASVPATLVGHVGDGNFHMVYVFHPEDPKETAEVEGLSGRLVERALAAGGTCTGEHGIGLGKIGYLAEEHGEGITVMRALKQTLDPHGLMNPGKVLGSAD